MITSLLLLQIFISNGSCVQTDVVLSNIYKQQLKGYVLEMNYPYAAVLSKDKNEKGDNIIYRVPLINLENVSCSKIQ